MRYLIIGIISLLVETTVYPADNIKLEINNMIRAAEIKYALPEGLLAALVHTESSGNHKAKVVNDGSSGNTSYGLVQIQLSSARFIQKIKAERYAIKIRKVDRVMPSQLMTPEINIDYGAAYLKWILETHENNISWALTCYNSGPNSRLCKNKRYSSYVGLVFNAYLLKNKK